MAVPLRWLFPVMIAVDFAGALAGARVAAARPVIHQRRPHAAVGSSMFRVKRRRLRPDSRGSSVGEARGGVLCPNDSAGFTANG